MVRIDDFSQATKRLLAARVGHVCSCPDCRAPTSGPRLEEDKTVNAGEAAHITAAQPGGPRYDPNLTPEQRRDTENGIWLCVNHATIVDRDESRYTVDQLRQWKDDAETRALKMLGRPTVCATGKIALVSPAVRLGAETAVAVDGRLIPRTSIFDPDEEHCRPTWFIDGFVVQFSVQKRQDRTNAIVEHFVVTVYETKSIPEYKPVMLAFPAEVNLYYIEVDSNYGKIPREFRPTRYYVAKENKISEQQYPSPLILDDNLPTQVAIRLNAKTSGMYFLSIDAVVTSGEDREVLAVMQPQWIIFEKID